MSAHVVDIWSEAANLVELIRPDWQRHSNCRGKTDLFYYNPIGRNASERSRQAENIAKALCAECQVKDACLRFALDADERHGVWGGLNTEERLMIRKSAS